jgi:hypothetical protein
MSFCSSPHSSNTSLVIGITVGVVALFTIGLGAFAVHRHRAAKAQEASRRRFGLQPMQEMLPGTPSRPPRATVPIADLAQPTGSSAVAPEGVGLEETEQDAAWQVGVAHQAVWQCGSVAVWQCGSVAVWQCGSVAVWQCGSVAVWQWGGIAAWHRGCWGTGVESIPLVCCSHGRGVVVLRKCVKLCGRAEVCVCVRGMSEVCWVRAGGVAWEPWSSSSRSFANECAFAFAHVRVRVAGRAGGASGYAAGAHGGSHGAV